MYENVATLGPAEGTPDALKSMSNLEKRIQTELQGENDDNVRSSRSNNIDSNFAHKSSIKNLAVIHNFKSNADLHQHIYAEPDATALNKSSEETMKQESNFNLSGKV